MPLVKVTLQPGDLRGKRQSAIDCPFARAVNRVLPYGKRVAVGKGKLTVLAIGPEPRPANVDIPLPGWVAQALADYDAGGPIPLFTVELQFPDL